MTGRQGGSGFWRHATAFRRLAYVVSLLVLLLMAAALFMPRPATLSSLPKATVSSITVVAKLDSFPLAANAWREFQLTAARRRLPPVAMLCIILSVTAWMTTNAAGSSPVNRCRVSIFTIPMMVFTIFPPGSLMATGLGACRCRSVPCTRCSCRVFQAQPATSA